MNWRAALRACLGLLLALPLLWLLQFLLHEAIRPPRPEEARFSPLLTTEQRRRLSTYLHDCSETRPCEPPLGCVFDFRNLHQYCSDSECLTDMQCPEGRVCHGVTTLHGPWVRLCVALGIRAEGERCINPPSRNSEACGPGLICAGDGWCGRPCGKGVPCPEGFFCSEEGPEPACLPTCGERGCPSGQECIRSREDGASTCAVVHGQNCQRTPCPPGRVCHDYLIPERPGKAWLECSQGCGDPEDPPCPEGTLCYLFTCTQRCAPEQPDTCGEGYTCAQGLQTSAWVCLPEWYHLYRR